MRIRPFTPIRRAALTALVLLCTAGLLVADEPRAPSYLYPAKDVAPAALKSDDRVVVAEAADH